MGILFSRSDEWNPVTDIPDLQGKVALVTGGSSGIGFQVTRKLAAKGVKVYFTARSKAKGAQAIKDLHKSHPGIPLDRITWLELDLSDLHNVRMLVQIMKIKENRLDILINNAGILPANFETNAAGLELCMAVCHVGHFALTEGLLPLFKNSSDPRVVTVSSKANVAAIPPDYPLNFGSRAGLINPGNTDPAKHTTFSAKSTRYAVAKLANVLFAQELQRRCDAAGMNIISTSVHPGLVLTEGLPQVAPPGWLGVVSLWVLPFLAIKPEKGARSPLFAATAEIVREKKEVYAGKYLDEKGHIAKPHKAAEDGKVARMLWETTKKEVET